MWNKINVLPRSKTPVLIFTDYKSYQVAWYNKEVNAWYTDSGGKVKLLGSDGDTRHVVCWLSLSELPKLPD